MATDKSGEKPFAMLNVLDMEQANTRTFYHTHTHTHTHLPGSPGRGGLMGGAGRLRGGLVGS